MKYIAVKDLPYDIFREMLKDESISGKNKRLLILIFMAKQKDMKK